MSAKAAKGWVVVSPDGEIVNVDACENDLPVRLYAARDSSMFAPTSWPDLERLGYRCLPCIITVSEDAQ